MPLSTVERQSLLSYIKNTPNTAQTHWENFSENIILNNILVLNVETENDLQAIVKLIYQLNSTKAFADKITMRVAAGGKADDKGGPKAYSASYSLSEGILADVIIRLVGKQFESITRIQNTNRVTIGAAIEIGDLDRILYTKEKLSLPTSSLIPYVTFGGLVANAGHGTGRDQPAVAGLIRSLRILRPDGEFVVVTENDPEFATIRGAHLGMFGIVTQCEIDCVPAKKLESKMLNRNLSELEDEIDTNLFVDNPSVNVMYIPTYQIDESTIEPRNNVSIIINRPVDLSVSNTPNHTPKIRHFGQELSIRLGDASHTGKLLARFPQLTPSFMKYIVSKVQVDAADSLRVGPWNEMAHYQESFPRALDDIDYIFAVDAKCSQLKPVMRTIQGKLHDYAARGEYPVMYAVYVRFFKGTQGGLSSSSQANDAHSCAVDIVTDPHIPSWPRFKVEMENYFINELGGRPHWGKTQPANYDYEKAYGQGFTDFKTTLEEWLKKCNLNLATNPFNSRFFSNVLKISAPVPAVNAEPNVTVVSNEVMFQTVEKCINYSKENDDISVANPHAKKWITDLEKVKGKLQGNYDPRLFSRSISQTPAEPKQAKNIFNCCVIM